MRRLGCRQRAWEVHVTDLGRRWFNLMEVVGMTVSHSKDPRYPGMYRVRVLVKRSLKERPAWRKVNKIPLTREQAISACFRIAVGQPIWLALKLARQS